MKRLIIPLSCAAILLAQSSAPKAAFEAADVHASAPVLNGLPIRNFNGGRGSVRGNRYELKNSTMVDMIAAAYAVDPDKVLEGPSWLEYDRFDVIARVPPNLSTERMKEMVQSLLASRFGLVAHPDTRLLPTFALTVGKKHQLKPTDGSASGCRLSVSTPGGGQAQISENCHNMTMAAFAETVRTLPLVSGDLARNPILDKTDLPGAWDFTLNLSLALLDGGNFSVQSTMADALESQLGLKLEPVKVDVPVVVVEKVNRKATDNLPGVVESFVIKSPAEFEVADIKPSDPAVLGTRLQFPPGGRLTISGMSMKTMIQQAWSLTEDRIVGAPKWMDTDRFDIVAKMPMDPVAAGSTGTPGAPPPTDLNTVWPLLRALLADRFKLVTHMEDQPATAYTLLAVKPKLTKADPTQRTRCVDGPGADGKDPRKSNPALSRLVTCHNITMAQLAEQLPSIANGYFRVPLVDGTGLEGTYDLTLSFSPAGLLQATGGGRGGGITTGSAGGIVFFRNSGGPGDGGQAGGEAAAPSGGSSIFDAVEKQLGLKLDMQKRPVPVLVIDHAEQKPADN